MNIDRILFAGTYGKKRWYVEFWKKAASSRTWLVLVQVGGSPIIEYRGKDRETEPPSPQLARLWLEHTLPYVREIKRQKTAAAR